MLHILHRNPPFSQQDERSSSRWWSWGRKPPETWFRVQFPRMSYGRTCLEILHELHASEIPPATTPSLWNASVKILKLSCLAVDLLWKGNIRTSMTIKLTPGKDWPPAFPQLVCVAGFPCLCPDLLPSVELPRQHPLEGQHLDLGSPQVNSSHWPKHEGREDLLWRDFDVFLMYLMQTVSVLVMDMLLTAKLIVYQFAFPKCNLKCL